MLARPPGRTVVINPAVGARGRPGDMIHTDNLEQVWAKRRLFQCYHIFRLDTTSFLIADPGKVMRSRLRRFRLGCVLIVLMSASSRAGDNPVPAEADTAVTPAQATPGGPPPLPPLPPETRPTPPRAPAAPTPGAPASRPTLAPGASEPLGTPSPLAAPSQPTAMATLPGPRPATRRRCLGTSSVRQRTNRLTAGSASRR